MTAVSYTHLDVYKRQVTDPYRKIEKIMNYLVTGCSRGVGLEICEILLAQGHCVYGVARGYSDEFIALEKTYSGRLFFKSVDLSDSDCIRISIFKEFISGKIQLHGFVNNAAMAYDDIVTNLSLPKLQTMYAVNVFTPMMITKYVLRNMLLHHTCGCIVHISSISAHTGYKGDVYKRQRLFRSSQ